MSKIIYRLLIAQREASHSEQARQAVACSESLVFVYQLWKSDRLVGILDVLNHKTVDLVMMDFDLTDSRGIETFSKAYAVSSGIPIIIVSDAANQALAVHALLAGAYDFFPRSTLQTGCLTLALPHIIERARYVNQLGGQQSRWKDLFRRARQRAHHISKFRSGFLANVSHEIRTPLNGIIGMTTLLRDSGLSAEQKEYVETLRHSGSLLMDLLNNVLDLAKIEAGKFDLFRLPFRPREIIEETMGLFAGSAREKGLTLSNIVDSSVPPSVVGDAARLRHVLANLIHNAIKFTDSGHITVRAFCERAEAKRMIVRFEVTDTGVGLSEEDKLRLFEPFSQVHRGDGPSAGSGLGLSISKRLARAMGGTMGVDSMPGKGSTFWFTIAYETGEGAEYARVHLIGKRVLLLSREVITREILQEQLAMRGMEPVICEGASSAVKHLNGQGEKRFHLVMINVSTSLEDEIGSLVADIRATPGLEGLPIILVLEPGTSVSWESSAKRIDKVLKAPLRQSQLYAHVASLIGEKCAFSPDGRCRCPLPDRKGVQPVPSMLGVTPQFLVVDDNDINRTVLVQLIRKLGYKVDSAANGQLAVEAAEKTPYTAIFMDLMMPVMSGYEATAILRQRYGNALPIIATTAHSLKNDREKCLAIGFVDYLTKPVMMEDLKRVLSKWPLPAVTPKPAVTEAIASVIALPSISLRGPVLEPAVLGTLGELKGDEAGRILLRDMLRSFIAKTPQIAIDLGKAVRGGAWAEVGSIAHKLKGSCGNLGAMRLASLCESLEAASQGQSLEKALAILGAFEGEFEKAVAEMQDYWRDIQEPRAANG